MTLAMELFCRAVEVDAEDPVEGMRLYQRAVQIDPNCEPAMANLGFLYFHQGEFALAEIWWLRALDANPNHVETIYNMGYLRLEQGMFTAAIDLFERALKVNERYADAHFNLAVALEKIGENEEARPHWRRYVQLGGEWTKQALESLGMQVIQGGKQG